MSISRWSAFQTPHACFETGNVHLCGGKSAISNILSLTSYIRFSLTIYSFHNFFIWQYKSVCGIMSMTTSIVVISLCCNGEEVCLAEVPPDLN